MKFESNISGVEMYFEVEGTKEELISYDDLIICRKCPFDDIDCTDFSCPKLVE